jgi:hypothetical protein
MKPRDLRAYSRQTRIQLIIGALVLLFTVGDGLIYLIYGAPAALMGLSCMGMGVGLAVVLLVIFWLMDVIVKRANRS